MPEGLLKLTTQVRAATEQQASTFAKPSPSARTAGDLQRPSNEPRQNANLGAQHLRLGPYSLIQLVYNLAFPIREIARFETAAEEHRRGTPTPLRLGMRAAVP